MPPVLGPLECETRGSFEALRGANRGSEILTLFLTDSRVKAQRGESVEASCSSTDSDGLVEAATEAVRFGIRHKQLSEQVVKEIEETTELSKGVRSPRNSVTWTIFPGVACSRIGDGSSLMMSKFYFTEKQVKSRTARNCGTFGIQHRFGSSFFNCLSCQLHRAFQRAEMGFQ